VGLAEVLGFLVDMATSSAFVQPDNSNERFKFFLGEILKMRN
jgi:hypothetical protein